MFRFTNPDLPVENPIEETKFRIKVTSSKPSAKIGVVFFPQCHGQDFHKGPKFAAQSEYLAQTAEEVHLTLTQALYRIASGKKLAPEVAYDTIIEESKAWEKAEEATINSLGSKGHIHRWNELLTHKRYPEVLDKIFNYYASDKEIRDCFDEEANAYASKSQDNNDDFQNKEEVERSLLHLIEETAVTLMFYRWIKAFDSIMYPGLTPPTIVRVLEKEGLDINWLKPKFEKIKKPTQSRTVPEDPKIKERIMLLNTQAKLSLKKIQIRLACKIVLIKRAVRELREEMAETLEAFVKAENQNLTLYKYEDNKRTLLIFAPPEYGRDNFDNGLWKQYVPLDTSDIVDLSQQQKEQLAEHEGTFYKLLVQIATKSPLENYTPALQFLYAYLVYKGLAPPASIETYSIENKPGFYFSSRSLHGEQTNNTGLEKILEFLLKIDPNMPIQVVQHPFDLGEEGANTYAIGPINVVKNTVLHYLNIALDKILEFLPEIDPAASLTTLPDPNNVHAEVKNYIYINEPIELVKKLFAYYLRIKLNDDIHMSRGIASSNSSVASSRNSTPNASPVFLSHTKINSKHFSTPSSICSIQTFFDQDLESPLSSPIITKHTYRHNSSASSSACSSPTFNPMQRINEATPFMSIQEQGVSSNLATTRTLILSQFQAQNKESQNIEPLASVVLSNTFPQEEEHHKLVSTITPTKDKFVV